MTYAALILAENPITYYRMDESSGTVAHDQTINGNNGTLAGTITYSQSGAIIGDSNTSMLFGASSTLSLPYTLNPFNPAAPWSALSLEYWIKLTGGWQHVVVTVNATKTTIYLNGVVYTAASGDPVLIDTDIYWSGSYMSGNLDEVALYSYVLSPSQIQTHYFAGLASGLVVSVAGTSFKIQEGTFKIQDRQNERSQCDFVLVDTTGTAIFPKGVKVAVSDSTLGALLTGVIHTALPLNLIPQPYMFWQIGCSDLHYDADKRTINKNYANQFAGTIVQDMHANVLAAEGVIINSAYRLDTSQADFSAGTLTNVSATSNVGDGDLELAPAGTAVTFTQGPITFPSTSAIMLTGTQGSSNITNARCLVQIWSGSYTIASNDVFNFDVWIPGNSPQQLAGMDFICTDGTQFSTVFGPIDVQSLPAISLSTQNLIPGSGPIDLTGFATNTWYTRSFTLIGSGLVGKTIQSVAAAFYGSKAGNYTAYFRNAYISNGGTTTVTFFSTTASVFQTSPQIIQNNSYVNVAASIVTAYNQSGSSTSSPISIQASSIARSSFLTWNPSTISGATGLASTNVLLTVSASIDGGVTYLPVTNHGSIPGLLPGMSLSGKTLTLLYAFANNGTDPTVAPVFTSVAGNVQPSYAATKSDIVNITNTQAGWNAGTLTNLTAPGGNVIQLNGSARNWDNASIANQTLYFGAPAIQQVVSKSMYMSVNTGADVRSRLDFAGQWQNFTAEVDLLITNTTDQYAVVYRTTGWSNTPNTFAYNLSISYANMQLGYGTNGGANSFTQISLVTFANALSTNTWHHLKVVVNGNNHQIFLDNILYINVNDSTYTAAGYIGLRYLNGSGATAATYFDNFGVVANISGTWVSPAIDIHSLGTIQGSEIIAQIDPANVSTSSVLLEISLNNGSTWATCTNGQTVPGLTNGTNVGSMTQVKIRVTISTTSASTGAAMPDIQGITLLVMGAYSSSGNRISPALNLASVLPRAGSTLVGWNAVTPANTSLLVDTSPDGATWTNIAASGNPIASIFSQPGPTIDSFDTNSGASYTTTNRTGGAVPTVTYDTANSRVTMTGGTNGLYVYNAISRADSDIVIDIDRSDAGGMVWRFVDASNFYYLVVADASASVGTPNLLTLNKVSANTLTQLATAAISFTRGTYHRIHVTMSAGVISVVFDGASVISSTDGSPLAAGKMGLFNNGGATGSRFYELWITPLGDVVTNQLVYTRQRLSSTDPTVTPQVLDSTVAVHGPNLGNGLLIPSSNYHYTFISNNMDDLSRKSNYYWTIGPTGLLTFLGGATIPSPWILDSNDPLVWELTTEYANDLYSNRQVLINVVDVTSFTNTFVGNGQSRSFACGYPLASTPTVTLNGQVQTVGLKGTTGSQFYYAIGDANIAQDNAGTILQQTDLLVVSATGTFTTDVPRDNLAGQQALAQLDGSTGIVEAVTDVSQIGGMNIATAQAYGDALNARYGVLGRTVKFTTPKTGLAVGQTIPAFVPWRSMVDVQLTIISIETSIRTIRQGAGAANRYVYVVEASEITSTGSWQKTIAKVKV